jgi:hypothetical protein
MVTRKLSSVESESSEEEEEPKHVTVKFSRQGQFGGQSQEDEPWMRLQAKSLEVLRERL